MAPSPLDARLSSVLGPKSADALTGAFGYHTIGDLLGHVPRRYVYRGELTELGALPVGEPVTVVAEVRDVRERRMHNRRGVLFEARITDGTGSLSLTFFNQPWRSGELRPGVQGLFAGKVSVYGGVRQLAHPDYELFESLDEDSARAWAERPIPIYPATAKLVSWRLAKMISLALETLPAQLPDDDPLLGIDGDWLGLVEAVRGVHTPATRDEAERALATLRFSEALELQVALAQRRIEQRRTSGRARHPGALRAAFDAGLPFTLTAEQQSVGAEIDADLARSYPMNRLLQGEVGSGKTLVAIRAMLAAAEDGGQSAFLAPTEVLATQHFRAIERALDSQTRNAIRPVLLTGSASSTEKRRALLLLASGEALIAVGTHALLSDAVSFFDLALVVVDEQHRFGVEQRETIRRKANTTPHTLVMTATPIPRTIAMTHFGDLEVSQIVHPPAGRPGVDTHVVPLAEKPTWRERVWQRIDEEVSAGRQAFIVAPSIEPARAALGTRAKLGPAASQPDDEPEFLAQNADDEKAEPAVSVTELHDELRAHPQLGNRRIGILHGQLPAAQKDEVMSAFAAGSIDVVIATTVIEVGVDVPNASVMAIFDAERFGISQLHQLRGRVGRGSHAGLCLLVTRAAVGTQGRARVDALAATTDGFALANADLAMRREGDVLGENQSGGRSSLKMLRVVTDADLIEQARSTAQRVLDQDPGLATHPGLVRALHRRLARLDPDFLQKN